MANHKWVSGDNLTGASQEGRRDGIAGVSKRGNVEASKEGNTGANYEGNVGANKKKKKDPLVKIAACWRVYYGWCILYY